MNLWQGFPEVDIKKLEDYGFIQSRPKGEFHVNNQQMSKLLHKAVGLGGKGNGKGQVPLFTSFLSHLFWALLQSRV